jgi:hypothetical protein
MPPSCCHLNEPNTRANNLNTKSEMDERLLGATTGIDIAPAESGILDESILLEQLENDGDGADGNHESSEGGSGVTTKASTRKVGESVHNLRALTRHSRRSLPPLVSIHEKSLCTESSEHFLLDAMSESFALEDSFAWQSQVSIEYNDLQMPGAHAESTICSISWRQNQGKLDGEGRSPSPTLEADRKEALSPPRAERLFASKTGKQDRWGSNTVQDSSGPPKLPIKQRLHDSLVLTNSDSFGNDGPVC